MVGGAVSTTLTWNVVVAVLVALLASHSTEVVPSSNMLPEAGSQVAARSSTSSVAVTEKSISAPSALDASAVMSSSPEKTIVESAATNVVEISEKARTRPVIILIIFICARRGTLVNNVLGNATRHGRPHEVSFEKRPFVLIHRSHTKTSTCRRQVLFH